MSIFEPDRYFARISYIDIKHDLKQQGFTCVLLDIDNTIRSRGTHDVPADVRIWLKKAQSEGILLCLLSNNWHDSAYSFAEELDIPIVAKALKPLPHSYLHAARKMGVSCKETVMVGDQISTDVIGAHLIGMKAYLVAPLVNVDLPHMVAIRHIERAILGGRLPEGPCPAPMESLENQTISSRKSSAHKQIPGYIEITTPDSYEPLV